LWRVPLQAIALEIRHPLTHIAALAILSDKLGNVVAALALTSRAFNAQHVQFASDIAEYETASGHWPTLSLDKLTFPRNALVRFVRALDAIFGLVAPWELSDYFVDTVCRIPTKCRHEDNNISDLEFMGCHRRLPRGRTQNRWQQLNSIDVTITGAHWAAHGADMTEQESQLLQILNEQEASSTDFKLWIERMDGAREIKLWSGDVKGEGARGVGKRSLKHGTIWAPSLGAFEKR
jgi:hypothetical protein